MMMGGNNNNSNNCNNNNSKYVTELRATDVLFGRGSGPNDHIGNIRFRQYVAERKAQYMSTNHRLTKTKIAREIVTMVLQEQGRFVKKVEPHELHLLGLPENLEYYELVDDDTIMEKAKQALRQNQNAAVSTAKGETAPVSSSSTDLSPTNPSSVSSSGGSYAMPHLSSSLQQQQQQQQQQLKHSMTSSGTTIKANNLSSTYSLSDDAYSLNDDKNSFRSNDLSYSNLFQQPLHPQQPQQQQQQQQRHPQLHQSSRSTNTTGMMASSTEDLTVSYTSYDLEPLPLMATSESQIPLDVSNNNNQSNHSNDGSHNSTATDAAIMRGRDFVPGNEWNNNFIDVNHNPTNRRHSDITEYQSYQQQQQRLAQLLEQQQLLNLHQQQLQMQMAAVFNGTPMDDTTPIPLQQQPHQRASSMLLQEQHALLLRRQQQQQEQERQLATAIRSLDMVYPIAPTTATASNNNNNSLNDHSIYNSSMAQLPHEELSLFSNKRNSIRIEDLEHVRATAARAMSGHHDIDDEPDHRSSQLPGGKNIHTTTSANPSNTHFHRHLPSMNSISNMSMSLRHIQRGNVDELMGSFNQMKTPSMEVNLDDPNSEGNNTNDNKNKNNHSSILSQEQRSKMMASTETMGTIEQIGSTTDMSILMGSSTFSLFRQGNESSAVMEESGTTGTTTSTGGATAGSLMQRGGGGGGSSTQLPLHRQNSNSQFLSSAILPSMASKSSSKTSSSLDSNNSFNVSDIFAKSSSNVINNYSSSLAFMSDVRRQIEEEGASEININDSSNYLFDETGGIATLPRTIGVMLELPDETNSASNQNSASNDLDMMGSSSLAVLQSALFHSTNTEIQDGEDNEPNGAP